MAFLEKPPFVLNNKGEIVVNLSTVERELLRQIFGDMRQLLLDDSDDGLKRLYPTAYHDDAERDAGYQALVHGELLEGRIAALEEVEGTLEESILTPEQLTLWMTSINGARLVLGTRLDVGEEDDLFDPDAPDAQPRIIYHHLGYLLEHVVSALTGTLPPATDSN